MASTLSCSYLVVSRFTESPKKARVFVFFYDREKRSHLTDGRDFWGIDSFSSLSLSSHSLKGDTVHNREHQSQKRRRILPRNISRNRFSLHRLAAIDTDTCRLPPPIGIPPGILRENRASVLELQSVADFHDECFVLTMTSTPPNAFTHLQY